MFSALVEKDEIVYKIIWHKTSQGIPLFKTIKKEKFLRETKYFTLGNYLTISLL